MVHSLSCETSAGIIPSIELGLLAIDDQPFVIGRNMHGLTIKDRPIQNKPRKYSGDCAV